MSKDDKARWSLKGGFVTADEEQFLSLDDVAHRLQVSDQTVRRWVKTGKLAAYKPGLEYRIREADLEGFLRAREVRPKAAASSESGPEVVKKESAATGHIQTAATAEMLVKVLEDIEQGRTEEAAAKLRQLLAA
jgi:excisionase family DNA binding protein